MLFCLFFVFAASLTDITVASHNLHSFKKSGAYHKACVERHGGIWMGQELWLSEKQLPSLQQLGSQFVARSGMEDATSNGVMLGRPFGGVSITWSSNLNHLISPISNFRHKRIVGAEMKTNNENYLFLCAYFPFFDSAHRAECMAETVDALTMLENIIEQCPSHSIIIGGDINTELKGKSPFDPLWSEFMTKYQLTSCDMFLPPTTTTYRHNSLNQNKWNDHFLVSESLIAGSRLSSHQILEDGDNLSDHLPIMMKLTAQINNNISNHSSPPSQPKLVWGKISDPLKGEFTSRLQLLLDSHPVPPTIQACTNTCRCRDSRCCDAIQQEYDFLVSALKQADASLPRFKPGVEKDWWTDGLSELRDKSIEIHAIWISAGRPRQGPTNDERLRIRAAYKRAIRAAQRAPKQKAWDRLHTSLAANNTDTFWKTWRKVYNKNKSHLPPVVEGCSSGVDIANCFKNSFQKNSIPNNSENVERLNQRFASQYNAYVDSHNTACDCKSVYITPTQLMDALLNMKTGKSADGEGIFAEHLHYAPLLMFKRLSSMFNAMLNHSFVPHQFRFGFMVPIIKDQSGNHADTSNYRGITISPAISKLFEHVLKLVFPDSLTTSALQFGFKKKSSTVHALHCLKETVTYFINHGSRVFCTFLDASKAFDRLVHSGLFTKLMDRNVPLIFLDIIISWYNGLSCQVKWGENFSASFPITAGVRQGGVLSPDFYSIYVDELLTKLRRLGKGCHYLGHFAAALFYADDMCVLSPSIKGLECLLRVCEAYCEEWDIGLNAKKSRNIYFGKRTDISHDILLNGRKIDWADQWPYLGVMLKSGKRFDCSVSERIKKFYRCVNSIFRIDGRSNDMVMLNLIEAHCIPLLTYAIEIVYVANRDERRQLRVAYNSVFRKIFCYRWSQSVTALQSFLGRLTWEQTVENRRDSFYRRIRQAGPDTLSYALLD